MPSRAQLLRSPDLRAILVLALLWLLFFWRLFTPIAADQASLAQGDFSGQFVAFAGYQYQRMSAGEIPLWNPYNNGGLPFIADTQAAVFYWPRWITLALSSLAGQWSYNALQLEMVFHALAYSLLMYVFVRRLTLTRSQCPLAALVSAIVIAYGGYVTGYPLLQLAILEAAVWFPLAALGILEATRRRHLAMQWPAVAGFGLGMSWLAGHPQTSWFMTFLLVTYLAWRVYHQRIGARSFTLALVVFALVSFGVCAVTLLPGIEYLPQTARNGLGFDAKGNGFLFKDIMQFIYPGAVSLWSPLYVGLPALFLVGAAAVRGQGESRFWLIVGLVGLIHSLGANSSLYDLTYNLVPGLRFFRGQERAAFVVANSLAILAGLGIVALANWQNQIHKQPALTWWRRFALGLVLIALVSFVLWMGDRDTWRDLVDIAVRSSFVALASLLALTSFVSQPGRARFQVALVALIVFDLFTVTQDHPGAFDPRPHSEQLAMEAPPLVQAVLSDGNGQQPFRVDGFRGLRDNFGSLYGVMDIRGISPLFLSGPQRIIYRDYLDNPLAWELFAVKYVYSPHDRLTVPSRVIATGDDGDGEAHLHQLSDPRRFAHLIYRAAVVDSDEFAQALMDDPRFDERENIVLGRPVDLDLPDQPADGIARVSAFAPEAIVIEIDTPANAILSIALPDYTGWQAYLNGAETDIIRAYGGLTAVAIPAGQHTLRLHFAPRSYTVGAMISMATWIALGLLAGLTIWRKLR